LTRPTAAPGSSLTRVPVLIGSIVVALCAGGAAVAAGQTTTAPTETTATTTTSTTTTSTTDDASTAPADATEDSSGTTTEEASSARQTDLRLKVERAQPDKLFLRSGKKASFTYETGGGSADLRIQAIKKSNGEVVQGWLRENVSSGERHRIHWNGSKKGGGKARKGTYVFRVQEVGGARLARDDADGNPTVGVYPAKFPVRGSHQYWDGWGAGRHHQGQDVGADCGTKLVAAQAGRVAFRGYDGGGYGNYVAINVRGVRRAHVYAHLKRRASVRRGERVRTGERIGRVGQTGNAVGCHLHFEYWKGRWGSGHAVSSVTKHHRKWDKWS
jgi:murein DD-endopeptidase MepM/ murein hydrolase activator NlpD